MIGSWLWTAIQRQMQRQQMLMEDNLGLREYLRSMYSTEELNYSSAAAWKYFFIFVQYRVHMTESVYYITPMFLSQSESPLVFFFRYRAGLNWTSPACEISFFF